MGKTGTRLGLEIVAEQDFESVPIVFGNNSNPVRLILGKQRGQWGVFLKMPWGTMYREPFSTEAEARSYMERYSRMISRKNGILIDDPLFPKILE